MKPFLSIATGSKIRTVLRKTPAKWLLKLNYWIKKPRGRKQLRNPSTKASFREPKLKKSVNKMTTYLKWPKLRTLKRRKPKRKEECGTMMTLTI